ncbi:MAG: SDR family NAD(P)-dependent oxidoreductase [Planctomycetia bacterium]
MKTLFDLTGKVAWVAGGGGYLGLPTCLELARHGATVIVTDGRKEAAEAAVQRLREDGLEAEARELSMDDEAGIKATVDGIVARHGALDIAVNMTYSSSGKPMMDMTLTDWQEGTKAGVGGAFLLAREAARAMLPRGRGSIIQFSSMYGLVSPDPRMYGNQPVNPIDYGVGKAALLQMVRYHAVTWAPRGVRVNAIAPGPFPNPAGMGGDAGFVERLSQRVPLGRPGRAEEIPGAVVYLASDAASFVTGTCLVIDDGWTAW